MPYYYSNSIGQLPSVHLRQRPKRSILLKQLVAFLLAIGQPITYTEKVFAGTDISEISITANRQAKQGQSIFGSWSDLDRDTLEKINALHIQQLTERIPGVNLHRNSGQESLTAIRSPVLTGSGACGSFLLAEDGIPLRPAGFCNVNELFESHFEQAISLEIARGPGTTLYGSNALHGVINVLGPAQINSDNSVALDFGPYDRGRLKTHLSSSNAALALTLSHDGGYRAGSGVDQQKLSTRFEKQLSSIKLTSGFTATNLNQETAGFVVGTDAYRDSELAKSNPNPEAFRDAWAARGWLRLEESGGDGKVGWVITPYLRTSNMDFLQHFLPGTPLEENGQDSIGVQSTVYNYWNNLTLLYGLDIEYAEGYLKQTQANPTVGSAFLQATIPVGTHYDYEVDALQTSPYTRLQLTLGDHSTVTAGLRFEYMTYDYNNKSLDGRTRDDGTDCGFGGCRYSRPADRSDYFSNWSPSLSWQYQLHPQHRVAMVIARGFRAPQINELYRLQREQAVADLDSEQLDSIELNYSGSASILSFELAAFMMKKDNFIFRDSDFFNVSDGKTKHQGIEATTNLDLSDSLTLSINGTYAKHQYDNDVTGQNIKGNDIDTAPRWFGSAQLQWMPSDTITVELEWQGMGSYYTDPENLHKYDGHDLANLRGSWQASNKLTLGAQLLNVFDADYAKRADFSSFSGDRYFPGEPTSLYIWTKLRF